MDWGRVKIILIVVFIIVNVFLIIQMSSNGASKQIPQNQMQDIKQLLSKKNIVLQTQILPNIVTMPGMVVINEGSNGDALANKIIGEGKWVKKQIEENESVYTGSGEELRLSKQGFFKIIIKDANAVSQINSSNIKEYIYKILKSYTIVNDAYQVDRIISDENGYELSLKYFYKRNEILNNYVKAKVLNSGEIIITQGLIKPYALTKKYKSISPIDALVKFLRVVDTSKQTVIKTMTLGYYAHINKKDGVMESGEADPVWRIETGTSTYFFDGYSGNFIEKISY